MAMPTLVGTHTLKFTTGSTWTNASVFTGITDGSWIFMSVLQGTNTNAVSLVPAGWSVILPPSLLGTRSHAIYGKIWHTGDPTSQSISFVTGGTSTAVSVSGSIMTWWGTGGPSNIDSMLVGDFRFRNEDNVAGSRFTNTAPSLTTTTPDTKVFTISVEATTATETPDAVVSYSPGWTQDAWSGHTTTIDTIWLAHMDMPTPGATGANVITYQNQQDSNGQGIQIGVPSVDATFDPVKRAATPFKLVGPTTTPQTRLAPPRAYASGDLIVAMVNFGASGITTDAAARGWWVLNTGTMNTRSWALLARRASAVEDYNNNYVIGLSGAAHSSSVTAVIRGHNVTVVEDLQVGTQAVRSGSLADATAPSIITTGKTLALALFAESTTALGTWAVTGGSFTEWAQTRDSTTMIDCVLVASRDMPAGGATGNSVTTNTQASSNGVGIQLGIPMATASTSYGTFVGSTSAQYNVASQNITLPVGSSIGDYALVSQMNSDGGVTTGATGFTQLDAPTVGTGSGYVGWKLLTATDITNGFVTVTRSTGTVAISLSVYRGISGFGALGTSYVRPGFQTTTTATAVTVPDSSQKILVIRLEKNGSGNPGPVSVSPTTTERASYFSNGAGLPSSYIGEYTGPGVTRTITDPVGSSSAYGVQVALLPVAGVPDPTPAFSASSSGAFNAQTTTTLALPSIAEGNWAIASYVVNSATRTATTPDGWTKLYGPVVMGARTAYVFGKYWHTGDLTSVTVTWSGTVSGHGQAIWGTGGPKNISEFVLGTGGLRSATGTSTTNVASSITVPAKSRVFTFSFEASATAEAAISSVSNSVAQHNFVAQETTNLETLWVGSRAYPSGGASGNTTITYPNSDATNGWAVQIGIPPYIPLGSPIVVNFSEAVGSSTTARTITLATPTGYAVGDILVAILRDQSGSSTVDWTAPSTTWKRVGPAFDPATQASYRHNAVFTFLIDSLGNIPAGFTFDRGSTASARMVAHMILLRAGSAGRSPVLQAFWDSNNNLDPVGTIDSAAGSYAITSPATTIYWAATEKAAPNSNVITDKPIDYTDITQTNTSTDTAISRTILYSAYKAQPEGTTSTGEVGVNWESTTSGAISGSLTFSDGSMPSFVGTGITAADGNGKPTKVFIMTAAGPRTPNAIIPIRKGFDSVSQMLAKPGFTWGHRGNSSVLPEASLRAYSYTVARGYGVLEVPLARTIDGVWFGLHDQYLDRTALGVSTTTLDPAVMTWAQVNAYTNHENGGNEPFMRWEDYVAAYGSTHVTVVDPKYALGKFRVEFLNMVYNDIGTTRGIVKYFGSGSGSAFLSTSAQAMGFQTWGYFYATDASAANGGNGDLQTWGPSWTFLGMEHSASQAIWNETLAFGKPIIAHIASNQANYATAMSKGASGVQCSATDIIAPVSWWTA